MGFDGAIEVCCGCLHGINRRQLHKGRCVIVLEPMPHCAKCGNTGMIRLGVDRCDDDLPSPGEAAK